jgi:hypothetical protein
MKNLLSSFILFLSVLFSPLCFAEVSEEENTSAQNEKAELYKFIDLYGGPFISRGEGFWEESSDPGGRSKLKFEDIDSTMWMMGATIKPYFYFLALDFRYASGHISSGTGTDSDFTDDVLIEKSESDIDGDTKYWSLELRAQLLPYRGKQTGWGSGEKKITPFATLEALFGWFHYQDKLDITNGVQIVPATGPISGLNSAYDFEWEGYKFGVKYEWDFIKKPSTLLYALGVKAFAAGLFLVEYKGVGVWNLRDDFAQNPSFSHEADGRGFEGQFGLFYSPFEHVKMELAYHALKLEADDGTSTTFFADGTTGASSLDKVRSEREGILLLLSLYF